MGYKLRRWLADCFPEGLSSGERLVALEIADQANDQTRRAYGSDTLAAVIRRTGFANERQLGKVLGKLGTHGVELRVPVRDKQGQAVTDTRGRPLFACNGHALEFYVPRAEECPALKVPQAGELEGPPSGRASTAEGPPLGPEGPPLGPEGPPLGGPISSISADPLNPPRARAVQIVTVAGGATDEEAEAVLRIIEAEHKVRSLAGFVATLADRGDLAPLLTRVRKANDKAGISAWLAHLDNMPPCSHGLSGGDQLRPDNAKPQCPQCRAASGEGGAA